MDRCEARGWKTRSRSFPWNPAIWPSSKVTNSTKPEPTVDYHCPLTVIWFFCQRTTRKSLPSHTFGDSLTSWPAPRPLPPPQNLPPASPKTPPSRVQKMDRKQAQDSNPWIRIRTRAMPKLTKWTVTSPCVHLPGLDSSTISFRFRTLRRRFSVSYIFECVCVYIYNVCITVCMMCIPYFKCLLCFPFSVSPFHLIWARCNLLGEMYVLCNTKLEKP